MTHFKGTPIISLERVKIDTSNLLRKQMLTSTSIHEIDPGLGSVQDHTLHKCWDLTDNISKTVQYYRDRVTVED